MPGTRDHEPVVIETFNGLWDRGDVESVPLDHFSQADNIQFTHSGFETRDAIAPYLTEVLKIPRVSRIYNFVTRQGEYMTQTLLVLSAGKPLIPGVDPGATPQIWHVVPTSGDDSAYTTSMIYSDPEMQDFGFLGYNGRAYITPFRLYPNPDTGESVMLGLDNRSVQVYNPATPGGARDIGGAKPVGGAVTVVESAAAGGHDPGFHLVGVVYETDTGYLTAPGAYGSGTYSEDTTKAINIGNIPVSPNAYVKKRHLVSTKAIADYNGNIDGYQFFFIPEGNIENNTATTKTVSYYDADLVDDASHLIDALDFVDAGVNLTLFHNRMVLVGQHDTPLVARVSAPGEPESFNGVDGLIVSPLDGHALTNCQEFRDVLYLFKNTSTIAYADNDDEPATWGLDIIDQAIGCSVHGVARVLDSGGVNIDYLLIADFSGVMLFNGTYARPELSWKISDVWGNLNRNAFHFVEIVNDSISKKIWITLMEPWRQYVLHANYENGLDAKNIRWSKWIFDGRINTVCLAQTTKLLLGSVLDATHDGILKVVKGTRDIYYAGLQVKIPDPTIRTALIGD